jgi:hypothetical protein
VDDKGSFCLFCSHGINAEQAEKSRIFLLYKWKNINHEIFSFYFVIRKVVPDDVRGEWPYKAVKQSSRRNAYTSKGSGPLRVSFITGSNHKFELSTRMSKLR